MARGQGILSTLLCLLTSGRRDGHTYGMKTAISLPEKVFREAERFARRVRKTRSRLYAEAIAEYLARHAPNDVTEAMNQVCDRLRTTADKFTAKAARGVFSSEPW